MHPCHRTLDWFHEETKLCKLTRCGSSLKGIYSLSPASTSAVIMGTGVAHVIFLIPNTQMLLMSPVHLNLFDLCICFSITFAVIVEGEPCVSISFCLLSALTCQARMQSSSIPIKLILFSCHKKLTKHPEGLCTVGTKKIGRFDKLV